MINVNARKLFTVILAALISGMLSLPASAGWYIKIGDLQGDSQADGRVDWIDILSISERISQPASGTGSARRRGDVVFDDIAITKYLQRNSPELRHALASGEVYPTVTIDITRQCADKGRQVIFRYELKNVQITSISMGGSSAADSQPVEELTMNFEEIKWIYDKICDGPTSSGTVERSWNIEQGKS